MEKSSKWMRVRSIGAHLAVGKRDYQLADMPTHLRASQWCKNIAITAICFDTIDKRFVDCKRLICRNVYKNYGQLYEENATNVYGTWSARSWYFMAIVLSFSSLHFVAAHTFFGEWEKFTYIGTSDSHFSVAYFFVCCHHDTCNNNHFEYF